MLPVPQKATTDRLAISVRRSLSLFMEGPLGEWMDDDLRDSLGDGPGCGTAGMLGSYRVGWRRRSVVRHHLPQLLEEVLDKQAD